MNEEIEISVANAIDRTELEALYSSVEWEAYTNDMPGLTRAVANSTHVVVAYRGSDLVGLARGLSDDVSVFYLQDILVRPEHQHQGIGRALLANCLERFAHVRLKALLTDDLPAQHRFYEALGYVDTRRITNVDLHAFIQIEGFELETGPVS